MTDTEMWEIVLVLARGPEVEAFEDLVEGLTVSMASFEVEGTPDWRITGYADIEPDAAALKTRAEAVAAEIGAELREVLVSPLVQKDWVAEVERNLKPIRVGPYYVFGSHVTDPPPGDAIPIKVDAGLAFGTGSHETTRGCLIALERLYPDAEGPRNPLDVGTGSGILAIAAVLRYGCAVTASDIDPVAVDVAAENAKINGVDRRITFMACDGLDDDEIRSAGPYDLIFANIVANPLIELAPAIAGALDAGGHAILSGLLAEQRNLVAAAYEAAGLAVSDEVPLNEWLTLVVARR